MSQYLARLGVVLGIDTAEYSADVDEVQRQTKKMQNTIASELRLAEKEYQRLKYATEDYGKEVTNLTRIQRQMEAGGSLSHLPEQTRKALEAQASALDAVMKKQVAGFKMGQQQIAALGYQTTDIITGLASGQNPLLVLIQQGGQLRDQFGGFKNVLEGISKVLTPMRVLFGGIAAAITAIGYAAYKGSEEVTNFNNAMTLLNNSTQLSFSGFTALSAQIADKYNISIAKSKEIILELAKSGNYTNKQMSDLGGIIAHIAKLSGQSGQEVAKNLIPNLDGSSRGAKSLNDQFVFLSLQEYKQIEILDKVGQKNKALEITINALKKAQRDQVKDTTDLGDAFDYLSRKISDASEGWKSFFEQKTREQKLNELYRQKLENQKIIDNTSNPLQKKYAIANLEAVNKQIDAITDEYANKGIAGKKARDAKAKIDTLEKERQLANSISDMRLSNDKAEDKAKLDMQLTYLNASMAAEKKFQYAIVEANREYNHEIMRDREETGGRKAIEIRRKYDNAVEQANANLAKDTVDIEKKKNDKITEANRIEIDARYQYQLDKANEFQKIDIQTQMSIQKAFTDFMKKEEDERFEFTFENMNILFQKIADAKAKGIQQTNDISRVQSKVYEDEQRTRANGIQLEQDRLALYSQNLLASEKDVSIMEAKLKLQQEIDKIQKDQKLTPEDKEKRKEEENHIYNMSVALANQKEQYQYLKDMNSAVFNDMGTAIDNFVKTGKRSFKDLARSIISDLMSIYLKAQILGLAKMFFGGSTTSIEPLTSISDFKLDYSLAGAKASGGPVSSGSTYLVGEKGPELFMPSSSGTIIPNNQLSGSMNSPQIVYNGPYIASMSAIDTQSATQFLARNKAAVWAANQSAQRSVPVSR